MSEVTEDDLDDDILAEAEAELSESSKETSKVSYRRMTDAEFAEAKTYWELGTKTLQEMADMYGITRPSLHERFKRAGVVRGSRAHELATAAEKETHKERDQKIERIQSTKHNHYIYAEALAKMTMETVLKARQDKRSLSSVDPDLTALNKAAKTLEVLRKERYALLDLDKPDGDDTDIPEILITELNEEQLEQIRAEHEAARNSANNNAVDDLLNDLDIEEEGIV